MSIKFEIPTIRLNESSNIPVIGLGTSRAKDSQKLIDAIKFAIDVGYRHFDCAWVYNNEDIIGQGLKEAIESSDGKLKREDLFITGKIWNTFHSKDMVRKCFEDTISKLQTTYLDLLLCHWPSGFAEGTGEAFPYDENGKIRFSDVHYLETYEAIENLYFEGRVKSIGISNFNVKQIQDIMEHCRVKPSLLQIEIHPHFPNRKLIEFCQENGIAVAGYAVIGSNERTWLQDDEPVLLENPVILKFSEKYGKSPAQICIKWALQQNVIAIVKSTTPSRLIENCNVFDFTITENDMIEINNISPKHRFFNFKQMLKDDKFYPFTDE